MVPNITPVQKFYCDAAHHNFERKKAYEGPLIVSPSVLTPSSEPIPMMFKVILL